MIVPLLLSLALAAAPADTASRCEPVLTLPEQRVNDTRSPSLAERRVPTGFVASLRPADRTQALQSFSDVFADVTGARIVQYGGLGAFATVSLRGAPPGQVSVYLDGTPMNSAASSVVNLADLPIAPIERVEVYRGSSPLSLGGAAPGGAIQLVSLSRPEVRELKLTRGSFGSWEGRASAGARRGAFEGVLHAGYLGSNGDYAYDDDNGTPLNAADDSVSTRANNRLDAVNALASVAWNPAGPLRAVLRQHLFRRAGGVAGLGAVPARHARLESRRTLTQFEVHDRGGAWRPRLALRGSLGRERGDFDDAIGELGLGRHDATQRFASEQGALEAEWPTLPRGVLLEGALSARNERADVGDRADGAPDAPRSRRSTRSGVAGVRLRPLGDHVLLRAARRWDRVEDRLNVAGFGGAIATTHAARTLDSPQLGAAVRPFESFELRANWARASRPPDFAELFGNQGSVLGNANLKEERSENWDAGARLATRSAPGARRFGASAEFAHFVSHARDLILYVRNSQSSVKAQNVSAARIEGDELTLTLDTPWTLAASAHATREDARDTGPVPSWSGKRLPQRPGLEAGARIEWRPAPFRLAADVHYLGDDYLDRFNRYRETSRTLVGASLRWSPPSSPFELTLEGKNLGDVRAADVGGFPLPGRSLWIAAGYRHDAASRREEN